MIHSNKSGGVTLTEVQSLINAQTSTIKSNIDSSLDTKLPSYVSSNGVKSIQRGYILPDASSTGFVASAVFTNTSRAFRSFYIDITISSVNNKNKVFINVERTGENKLTKFELINNTLRIYFNQIENASADEISPNSVITWQVIEFY